MLKYLVVIGPKKYRCTACGMNDGLVKPILVEISNWVKVDLENRFEVGFELLREDEADQDLTSDNPEGRLRLLTRKRRYETELSFVSRYLEQLKGKKVLLQEEIELVCKLVNFNSFLYGC